MPVALFLHSWDRRKCRCFPVILYSLSRCTLIYYSVSLYTVMLWSFNHRILQLVSCENSNLLLFIPSPVWKFYQIWKFHTTYTCKDEEYKISCRLATMQQCHCLPHHISSIFPKSCQWCHLLFAQSQFPCPVLLPSRCNWTMATNQQQSERTVAAWGLLAVSLGAQLSIRSHFYSCW